MSNEYNSESIKVLDDINHMRLRKGMYVGETDNPRALISEIIDNALDEVQAGFSSELVVYVDTKNNTYTVRDYGRGIPHGKKTLDNGEEKEVLEIICTKANSGGKFDNRSYMYSAGLNGVGITVTNALSTEFIVTSYRDGKYVKFYSNHGDNNKLTYGDTEKPNGTEVVFSPDPSMFKSAVIPVEFIKNRCKVASAFGFKSRLIVDHIEIDTNSTIFDLITEDSEDQVSLYYKLPVIEVTADNGEKMKVAIEYTSATNDRYFGYTNLISNYLGGNHVHELSKSIVSTWNDFINDHKKIKPVVDLRNSDYLLGIRSVCAVFIMSPEFSSQTKEKLVVNRRYFDDLMKKFRDSFYKILEDNIILSMSLIKRFEEYRLSQNKLLARKEISSLIKVNTDTADNIRRRSVVSKLVECTSKKRDNTELFLVEGNSAMGPYLSTRNKELQAILPLRGKILNVTMKDVKDAVKNNEICDIANSMGCGIGSNCDASKSRYERVIISADADPDGLQINCLVLSVFINMFPDMVRQGRVFISVPPLFCWGTNKSNYGWSNSITGVPDNAVNVTHFKGLGEMNSDQLEFFLVNPETRNLIQVEYPSDVDKFNKILGTGSGKNELMRELGIIKSSI